MWKKLETILCEHRFIVGVTLLAVLVIGALLITERILMAMVRPEPQNDYLLRDELGFWVNVITEVFGIGITVVIIERFNRRREDQRRAEENAQEAQRKREETIARIIREMRSSDENEGRRATEEAREIGILEDGTFHEINLLNANLSGADLGRADLSGAHLGRAQLAVANMYEINLSDADLPESDMSGADLYKANLENSNLWMTNFSSARLKGAKLKGANLRNANLSDAELEEVNLSNVNLSYTDMSNTNLQMANISDSVLANVDLSGSYMKYANLANSDLSNANLSNASLSRVNLQGVDLRYAKFNEKTELPDKTYWTLAEDVTRFTRDNHPELWVPHFVAAGYISYRDWRNVGQPHPWVDAGYGEDEWNEWVRDGRPAHKPTDDPNA
ncbi:MAG: pentapeptide repeat-containing protein [Chloroflexota bacterium]